MKRKLNVAMVGSGFMGKVHSHAWMTVDKIYAAEAEPVLKVAVGRGEKMKDFAAHWGYEEWSNDFQARLQRPDLHTADIPPPPAPPPRPWGRPPAGPAASTTGTPPTGGCRRSPTRAS